jgi:hypothetical protein
VVIVVIEYLYIIEHTYIHNTYGVAQDISYSLHTFSMICVHSSVPVFRTRYEHSLVLEYPYGIEPLNQAMTLSLASGCPTLVSYPSLFPDIQPRLARGRVTSLSRVFLSAFLARVRPTEPGPVKGPCTTFLAADIAGFVELAVRFPP